MAWVVVHLTRTEKVRRCTNILSRDVVLSKNDMLIYTYLDNPFKNVKKNIVKPKATFITSFPDKEIEPRCCPFNIKLKEYH